VAQQTPGGFQIARFGDAADVAEAFAHHAAQKAPGDGVVFEN